MDRRALVDLKHEEIAEFLISDKARTASFLKLSQWTP